jgi:hypothetical protein
MSPARRVTARKHFAIRDANPGSSDASAQAKKRMEEQRRSAMPIPPRWRFGAIRREIAESAM